MLTDKAWKVDHLLHIIYISNEMPAKELLALINWLTTDPDGLLQGPQITWKIVTVDS